MKPTLAELAVFCIAGIVGFLGLACDSGGESPGSVPTATIRSEAPAIASATSTISSPASTATAIPPAATQPPPAVIPPTNTAQPPPPPAATAASAPPTNCHPSYQGGTDVATGGCVRQGVGDYDCLPGSGNGPNYVRGPVTVVGPDEFDLDTNDPDNIGCEP
ncbi:MAG TPA: hypothetical protein VJB57_19855 [Dehalococcoidia bacterium]|nr:hypothetical protein [Dehalococcoidia bacterium]